MDEKTFFLKVHATWDALATGAELLNIRKRIKMPKVGRQIQVLQGVMVSLGFTIQQQHQVI